MTTIRELTVISGKGGTGKTTFTAALATLASGKAVLADCDVDAADLHLILKPDSSSGEEFYGMNVARLDPELCTRCGKCVSSCRFDAITPEFKVLEDRCEGCGVCEYVCGEKAVVLGDRLDGHLFSSHTRCGTMIHARLKVGGEASGKLVADVRDRARKLCREEGLDLIITDGPPGIGCPVISSISGTDLALVITEPTLSGISDLDRVLDTTRHFGVDALVVVNKADINPGRVNDILDHCRAGSIPVLGQLPFDTVATDAMVAEKSVIEYAPDHEMSKKIREIWEEVDRRLRL